ncbi:MAG: YggS family pyridoxal phosphate-dependent enzyme [Acidipila sp.]|nr:YggS family pyridoxal phosphate-dependent enzyme [Acidipila sp.]
MSELVTNLARVRERMARAAARAGRNHEDITLVAVSKTRPAETIREAYHAGVRHFGENRVQEWESKQAALSDVDATWQLIGHLQSNKARRAAGLFHSVDSVDSVALAQKLNSALADMASEGSGKISLGVLIELRVSPEETKTGVEEEDLPALVEAVLTLPHLELRGLMCVPPFFDDPEKARPFFRRLREARDALRSHLGSKFLRPGGESFLAELSMGMSHDFEVAIEEGATQVRVGSAIFGARTA